MKNSNFLLLVLGFGLLSSVGKTEAISINVKPEYVGYTLGTILTGLGIVDHLRSATRNDQKQVSGYREGQANGFLVGSGLTALMTTLILSYFSNAK